MSMEFSRQDYWSGLPFPPPGDLPNPGIYSAFPALVDGFLTTEPPEKPHLIGLRTKIEILVTLLPVIECPHVPQLLWASLAASIWDTWARCLSWENPLEKAMATHSSSLAWKIPWTEELDRLQSMGSQRAGHD